MRQFYAPTEDFVKSAVSWLSTDYSAGVSSITLKNAEQFVANKYVIIGRDGDETSEIRRISSITGNALTLDSNTTFNHYIDAIVTQIDYDQRKLYYRATSTDDWAEIDSGSPVNIAVSSPLGTLMEDSAGTSTTQYVSTYYDSNGTTETDTADCEIVLGTASSVNLCTLQSIRNSAGWQDNPYIPDSRIDEARTTAQGEVWSALRKRYSFPLTKHSGYLERIVIDMAVGYLYIDEYGKNVENVALDGYKKIEDARKRLEGLAKGDMVLYDESTGEDQTLSATDTVKFYPDNSTGSEDADDGRVFSMGMKF
jgi:phage gp36-like protein